MPATLYLSAHPDDAVLSCGGTLALDASAPTRDAAGNCTCVACSPS